MAEPMICVAWNVHANELTTICNTMLENELCVDCTIVAEGKSLKAHRLILSTCSPFFHMLFSEQRDEHPIVIITDTLFYTLKSVIDFVYCGKTKIPANQFEEFWKLAVSLQIKGLGNSLQIDTKTDIGSIGERNVMPSPSIVNHDICKIGSLWTSEEHDSTNSLQQHPLHVPYGYIDTAKTDPSVLVEGCCDFVQSGEKMMPQHSYKRCSVQYDPDVSINPEINVKIEPLCFESEILETKNSVLSHQSTPVHIDPEGLINTETSVKIEPLFSESEISATKPSGLGHERSPQHQDFEVLIDTEISVKHEPLYSEIECLVTRNKTEYLKQDISENIKSETIDEQSPMFNHNLDQYSCGRESLDVIGNSALIVPTQQQHVTCWPCKLSPELAEGCDSLPSKHSMKENEKADGVGSKAYMGPQDVADDETVEMNVRTASPLKQNSNVGFENILADEQQPKQISGERRRGRRRPRESSPSLAPSELPEISTPSGGRRKRRSTGERPHPCNVCGKAFITSSNLKMHKRIHTGERPHKCDVCGKAFVTSSDLKTHKRTHTGERPHQCDVCGKAFITSRKLKIHKRIHTGERPHKCDVCRKAFAKSDHLKIHKRTHTGDRPHKCDVCGKAFVTSSDLKIHKRTHTGERPHQCDVCGRAFVTSGNLKTHKRIHTGERPHQCDVCGKAFAKSDHLKIHKRTHTGERPHKCDVCGNAFAKFYYIKIHKRTHTGERPHKCDVCRKAFAKSDHLKIYKRTHTGERPHKCDVCGKVFAKLYYIKIHKPTHTGERPHKCNMCVETLSLSFITLKFTSAPTRENALINAMCAEKLSLHLTPSVNMCALTWECPYICSTCGKRSSR